jgi:uncharacterized damage-inducible protein DinB
MDPPQFPAGPYVPEERDDPERRRGFVEEIERAPAALGRAVEGLSTAQLDTKYRNWTIRQIVHHLADSHTNGYIRLRLALTELHPTIKPYNETLWSNLEDARTADIAPSLAILEGLHHRWAALLRALSPEQFARTYFHPEYGESVPLFRFLGLYAWHGRHHTGQITWLRAHHGWSAVTRSLQE